VMMADKYKEELARKSMTEFKAQGIITGGAEMGHVLKAAQKLAHIGASNILILGESGTGKGLLSTFIHQQSDRREKPFIQINCAALPETLLEAELFGYEKGAFTGAREQGKAGLIELAHEGTLLLDEIGDLPLPLQAKLLKFLDDQQVLRLGGTKPRTIDCAVIAATNRDLEAAAGEGRFRQDLYYRLNAFTLQIPPLRDRSGDIFELVQYFLSKYNHEYGQNKRISQKGFGVLQSHRFPGNIRELQNILKRAVVMSDAEVLDDFIISSLPSPPPEAKQSATGGPNTGGLNAAVAAAERRALLDAMGRCRNTREMAAHLGVSHATVIRKMKKHGLKRR